MIIPDVVSFSECKREVMSELNNMRQDKHRPSRENDLDFHAIVELLVLLYANHILDVKEAAALCDRAYRIMPYYHNPERTTCPECGQPVKNK